MCHEILLTFVTESLCKKGIVISTSNLLSECQVSEHITCMDSKSVSRLVKNPRHITAFTSPTKPISQKCLHHKWQTTTRTSVVRRKMTYSMHTFHQFLYSYRFNTDVLPNKQQIVQLCKHLWPEIKTDGYWNVCILKQSMLKCYFCNCTTEHTVTWCKLC